MSNETTLEFVTNDKEILKKSFYELVDELYERIKNNKYHFRTVGIKLMKTDFSVETKKSYNNYPSERKSIESVIEELLNKFFLADNTFTTTTTNNSKPTDTIKKILPIRKVGLRV